ncbi:hypothetical protein H2198_001095 [Neophaeococcomyces mojaviensis]|uniref:Uncharacterized protein n=1 Tax=Neophaeococcomyces mojaviensis TaxID=3383035 RepID=A0ACC3AIC2_9EURO|nr:hypothetical protein H2198_001095 [Knufia sp. JES_112]
MHNLETTFLSLPSEVRSLIYDYVIPPSRLTPFPLGDTEWSMKTNEARVVPSILFTCREIYNEAVPLFYSRAILEVAPAQAGNNWFSIRLGSQPNSHSYSHLLNTFRFCKADHLKLIRRAHIFSNQSYIIDGECYESLLQWLIKHTSTEKIELSARPMTRIRGKVGFDLPSWRSAFVDRHFSAQNFRTIRLWTKAKRLPWEYEHMMRLKCSATDGTLVPMQIYFWSPTDETGNGIMMLDPRWLTRTHDDEEKIAAMNEAAPLIDELMGRVLEGRELKDYRDNSRHVEGDAWVYQMIVVANDGDGG